MNAYKSGRVSFLICLVHGVERLAELNVFFFKFVQSSVLTRTFQLASVWNFGILALKISLHQLFINGKCSFNFLKNGNKPSTEFHPFVDNPNSIRIRLACLFGLINVQFLPIVNIYLC